MKTSITAKIGLLLALATAGSVVGAWSFYSFLDQTRADSGLIRLAARQRTLCEQLYQYAHMVHRMGDHGLASPLADRARQFDTNLTVLRAGGNAGDVVVGPAPREVEPHLAEVERLWRAYRPRLATLAEGSGHSADAESAYVSVEADADVLARASYALLQAYEARTERLRARTFWTLVGVVGFNLAVLLAGYWFARRTIVRPVRELERAARRVEEGDLAARVEATTNDELATLGRAFNDMSTEVGRLLGMVDVQRKYAENIVANVPVGLLVLDEGLRVARANQAFRSVFGDNNQDPAGRDLDEVLAVPGLRLRAERVVREGGSEAGIKLDGSNPDGSSRPLRFTLSRVRLGNGGGQAQLLLVVEDLSEEERLRAQLAQADRMASVGVLAAGVAHEINNPLTFVMVNVEDALEQIEEARRAARGGSTPSQAADDAVEASLRDAMQGAGRVRDIVQDLKTFSHVAEDKRSPVQIARVLDAALNMACHEIKYRARVVKDLEDVPPVLGSDGRLSQVLLNLLVNSAHAIPIGNVSANEIRVRTWREDRTVCVEIADTGSGIRPEHLERIFDPFFTTKPTGVGSGLGLAICHSIVRAHGGTIAVSSELGRGTRFVIRLPALDETAVLKPVLPARASLVPAPRARARILVVDDDELARSTLMRLLSRDHDVRVASSGVAAKALLEANAPFDLVLCDVIMPEVSGIELHEWVRARHPEWLDRIVFMTGGASNEAVASFLAAVPNTRIDKPFDARSLRELVAERAVRPAARS
jgi:PAS domain S-box-containing protein